MDAFHALVGFVGSDQDKSDLLVFRSMHDFAEAYRGWIDESVKKVSHSRDGKWTESIAVGSKAFVTSTKEQLGVEGRGRKVIVKGGSYELREAPAPYKGILGTKMRF